ncbi:MAG: lytic transglycosylase domain-containing protein [Solirubrobacterales bacterium]|nr:lytic transglycosylase domain-containing protein [Solirubrobacterales bacterium]MBV9424591.1 lytic transglycosylase domain-containing protein [Solirubrobacterales bacterium]MBV9798415.1 lytic transglycosylase domain-containing protein [Solirubrobacterales bacterium]
MSVAGASGTAAARRRAVVRRRRRNWMIAVVVFAAAGVLVVLTAPLFEKTINQFTLPLAYQDVIREQAADKHLDPALIAAVIYAETKFDPRPSAAGAQGPMQIMPATAEYLARRSGATTFTLSDLGNPQINIAYGSYLLRYLLDRYRGNTMLALAAYNAGETNVDRWLASARSAGHPLTVADIPFPETRDYVQKVLDAQRAYRRTYATQLGYH